MSNNFGVRNGQWKGDEVSVKALHDYIKYHLAKPEKCQLCYQVKKLDLANISQNYKRDLNDWEWIYRKCHMIKDGRINAFLDSKTQSERSKKANKHKKYFSREEAREALKQQRRKHYSENKKQYHEYRLKNKEKFREYSKRYYLKYRDQIKAKELQKYYAKKSKDS